MVFLTRKELVKAARLWGQLSEKDLRKARKAFAPLTQKEMARAYRLLGFTTYPAAERAR